ncbi:unnamed protein product [Peronospora destructor]|uniref:Uncharacterized protein n=1 Tax=Peronospora destructor TaxID=86335 RepID=A0AAV0TYH3_9STRA|nr:unnamed protein product [Peronospora destructor]
MAYTSLSQSFDSLQHLLLLQELYIRYMGKHAAASWQKSNPTQVLFNSLCRRRAWHVAKSRMGNYTRPFGALEPSQDADIRLVFLALPTLSGAGLVSLQLFGKAMVSC